jgi:hypothetical protein
VFIADTNDIINNKKTAKIKNTSFFFILIAPQHDLSILAHVKQVQGQQAAPIEGQPSQVFSQDRRANQSCHI